jgi:peptidoglycan/LPS O-acetylase OafA/YrhL
MRTDSWFKSRWWTPAVCGVLGAIVFAAVAIGGDLGKAAAAFGVMAAVGLVFLIGAPRSETIAGLGGPGRDERWAALDLRASAVSGFAVMLVIIGTWLYELAQGHDGNPYGQLAAVGGISYLVAVLVLRARS